MTAPTTMPGSPVIMIARYAFQSIWLRNNSIRFELLMTIASETTGTTARTPISGAKQTDNSSAPANPATE